MYYEINARLALIGVIQMVPGFRGTCESIVNGGLTAPQTHGTIGMSRWD